MMTKDILSKEDDQVYLRSLTMADCSDKYLGWLNNKTVSKYLETRFTPQTADMVKDFVKSVNDSADSFLFGIFMREGGGTHIGNIKIGPVHPRYKFADISYFIGEQSYWGKGLAKEAIDLVTQFGFNNLGLNRIQAGVHGSNIASQRVLEKCGYKKEAVLRNKIYYNDGEQIIWDDHLYYGLLMIEYKKE